MEPTYSFKEIKALIRTLDFTSFTILEKLVEEEKDGYTEPELRAFIRFRKLKNKQLVMNEVKAEFLLSFN